MDQRAVITLTINKEDREYIFSMPHGANFGEAYDAAFAMLQEIVEMSKKAADRAKRIDSNEKASNSSVETAQ